MCLLFYSTLLSDFALGALAHKTHQKNSSRLEDLWIRGPAGWSGRRAGGYTSLCLTLLYFTYFTLLITALQPAPLPIKLFTRKNEISRFEDLSIGGEVDWRICGFEALRAGAGGGLEITYHYALLTLLTLLTYLPY